MNTTDQLEMICGRLWKMSSRCLDIFPELAVAAPGESPKPQTEKGGQHLLISDLTKELRAVKRRRSLGTEDRDFLVETLEQVLDGLKTVTEWENDSEVYRRLWELGGKLTQPLLRKVMRDRRASRETRMNK